MIFARPYQESDFDAALALLIDSEQAARASFPALPAPDANLRRSVLARTAAVGNGAVAYDAESLVGMLLFGDVHSPFHGDHIGVWAPVHAFVARGNQQDRVVTSLIRTAMSLPQLADVDTWSLTMFANELAIQRALMMNGFGVRVADAVILLDDISNASPPEDIEIRSHRWQEAAVLLPLKQALDHHLTQSPVRMAAHRITAESMAEVSERRESRFAVAWSGDKPIGYIELTANGENYLTESPAMANICGAYVLPHHRGTGIMSALLYAATRDLPGITAIGVDYETINPEARMFWENIFTPYTIGWQRRTDRPLSAS